MKNSEGGWRGGVGVKSKLVVARGSTGPQRSGCRFLEWVYCLTSCFFVISKCRSCGGRDRMVVGLKTTYACNQCISPLQLLVRIPQMERYTRYSIM